MSSRRRPRPAPLRVVFVPGLGDRLGWLVRGQQLALRSWWSLGVRTTTFRVRWSADARFADRVAALVSVVDGCHARGERVALLGASAGAGAVLAAFAHRPEVVAVALVAGKFRRPDHLPDPVLDHNDVFDEALRAVPGALERLGPAERRRILSLRSTKDGVIPDDDPVLPGAVNERMPVVGHVTAIGFALVVRGRRIVRFAREAASELGPGPGTL
jgi:hypothetical protein